MTCWFPLHRFGGGQHGALLRDGSHRDLALPMWYGQGFDADGRRLTRGPGAYQATPVGTGGSSTAADNRSPRDRLAVAVSFFGRCAGDRARPPLRPRRGPPGPPTTGAQIHVSRDVAAHRPLVERGVSPSASGPTRPRTSRCAARGFRRAVCRRRRSRSPSSWGGRAGDGFGRVDHREDDEEEPRVRVSSPRLSSSIVASAAATPMEAASPVRSRAGATAERRRGRPRRSSPARRACRARQRSRAAIRKGGHVLGDRVRHRTSGGAFVGKAACGLEPSDALLPCMPSACMPSACMPSSCDESAIHSPIGLLAASSFRRLRPVSRLVPCGALSSSNVAAGFACMFACSLGQRHLEDLPDGWLTSDADAAVTPRGRRRSTPLALPRCRNRSPRARPRSRRASSRTGPTRTRSPLPMRASCSGEPPGVGDANDRMSCSAALLM